MNFAIIVNEAHIVAVRSRGPGGQNVNKVSSAAQLFWNYATSLALTEAQKTAVGANLANMINSENQIYLRADEFRDLERNSPRAEKLEALLKQAFAQTQKPRRATKPTRASKVRKMENKAKRGFIKKGRQKSRSQTAQALPDAQAARAE